MNKFYNSRTFQFFAIVIISSLCLLLDQLTRINFNKIELPKNRPEYKALGVDGKVFSRSGKLKYNLVSEEAWEYPADERIFLRKLQLYLYDKNSDLVQYEIDSNDAWINQNTKIGLLGESSVITVENSDPNKVIRLYGRQINLDMDKNIFSSNNDAHATQGKSVVYTHGFNYDDNKQFLILNSKVRVIYAK